MNLDPTVLATLTLALFAALSFHDGVVIHLLRERLPFRAASRREHQLHTVRAVLFPAILISFFAGGGPLWLSIALLIVDQLAELGDALVERDSRVHTVGLLTGEYVLHGVLVTLRSLSIAFTAMAPAGAAPLSTLAWLMLPGAVLMGVVHVALALYPEWFLRWHPEATA